MTTDLPRSTESEQAVIGAVLLYPECLHQIRDLAPADFADPGHRAIFTALIAMEADGDPVDVITLAEHLESAGTIELIGGLPYLMQIAGNTPSAANVAHYAAVVRDRAVRRRALQLLHDAHARVLDSGRDCAEVIGELSGRLDSIATTAGGESQSFSDVLSASLADAKAAHDARKAGSPLGAPWGLPSLDRRTGGLRGPRLWIVAGRTGLGKTALVYQSAIHAAARGFGVGIVSLEMGAHETGDRALALRFELNSTALGRGDADEFERLQAQITRPEYQQFRALPILYDFGSFRLSEIVARITAWRRAEQISYAVVDHIGLIETDGFSTRVDQLGHASRTLKKLAKRLDMPIVVVSQLNRNVEREKRRPMLADLRDSGNLEQDADCVIMLHKPGDSSEDRGLIELGILKQRNGVTGWLPAAFSFDGRTQTFRELADESGRPRLAPVD